MAIAALLFQRKVLIPDSIRVRAESRYFLFQVSTKGGTTSAKVETYLSKLTGPSKPETDKLFVSKVMRTPWRSLSQRAKINSFVFIHQRILL